MNPIEKFELKDESRLSDPLPFKDQMGLIRLDGFYSEELKNNIFESVFICRLKDLPHPLNLHSRFRFIKQILCHRVYKVVISMIIFN